MKNKHVDFYINQYKNGEIKVSRYVVQLFSHLKKKVLNRDDVYFDIEMHENYITFAEKYYFPLQPFQKFLTAFIFLFHKEDDTPVYSSFFWFMGRGAGKNGLISTIANFMTSELHGIKGYDVPLVANSEAQARTSFDEIRAVMKSSEHEDAFDGIYDAKASEIVSLTGHGKIEFLTSNAKTKDSRRDGMIIYDEIHEYLDGTIVGVFTSGLGKVRNSREFFLSTDGFVRGGYLDGMKQRSRDILNGDVEDSSLFPFMATLDSDAEIEDIDMWEKANPMYSEPMGAYAKEHKRKAVEQYRNLKYEGMSERINFMTKRMNRPAEDLTTSVASWEEILRTGYEEDEKTLREIPDLKNQSAIGGLDFASIRDFAAVGLLFKINNEYIWNSHSFVNAEFLRNIELKAPINEWEEKGLLTIVDEKVISVDHIVDWFVEMREQYNFDTIVADTFRLDLVKSKLEEEGFNIMYVRTKGIEALLAPRIETIFAENRVIFGDNPLSRWYVNNVKVTTDAKGNRTYGKKDEVRRKTDGFMAFIHAMYRDDLIENDAEFMLDEIDF